MSGLVSFVEALGPVRFWVLAGLAGAIAITGFHVAFRYLKRARMLEDVPTSRVRSASQGYVELQGVGRVLDGPPIVSPLTRTACTWWWYRIEKDTGDRRKHWTTLSEAASDEIFALEDETGRCIIDPEHAEVYPAVSRTWRGNTPEPGNSVRTRTARVGHGRYRYTEKRMHAGDPLYAIGQYQTRYLSDHWDTDLEAAELLRRWKADRPTLLQRFDRNRDGEIDLKEWDVARFAARSEVLNEQRDLDTRPGLNILFAPTDGRPFLLGALPQPRLATQLRRKAIAGLITFTLSGLALALLLVTRFG